MSRHSKNNTASSVFTYYERRKVRGIGKKHTDLSIAFISVVLGFGTLKGRLGGENMRNFEDCWLCLRPAVKPVCTPNGRKLEYALPIWLMELYRRRLICRNIICDCYWSVIFYLFESLVAFYGCGFRLYLLQRVPHIEFCFAESGKRSSVRPVGSATAAKIIGDGTSQEARKGKRGD